MMFYKKRKIIVNKPVELVRENLNAESSKENIQALSDIDFRGHKRMNAWKSGAIISKIHLEPKSVDETLVEIENEFDISTRFYLWGLSIIAWSIGVYSFFDGDNLLSLEILLLGIGPIVLLLIGRSSFDAYEKSTLQFYKSIIESRKPN